jgi:predicted nucleic acid-binding protein
MSIVVDTSAVIAVVLEEPEKSSIIELTRNATLIAPSSLYWEFGNALSLMFKKKRLVLSEAVSAFKVFREIPIQLVSMDLEHPLELAHKHGIYAYDAYVLSCAIDNKAALLTLDRPLADVARACRVKVIGAKP